MRKIERTPEYIEAMKAKAREKAREWREKDRDFVRDTVRKSYYKNWEENKEKARVAQAQRRAEGKAVDKRSNEAKAEYMRQWRQDYRQRVFALYGSRCICCGETNHWLLTLDHVNNDGFLDRGPRIDKEGKRTGKNTDYAYRAAMNDPEQRARFQLRCFNCNCGKGHCHPYKEEPSYDIWQQEHCLAPQSVREKNETYFKEDFSLIGEAIH